MIQEQEKYDLCFRPDVVGFDPVCPDALKSPGRGCPAVSRRRIKDPPRVLPKFEHACSTMRARGLVDQTQGHRSSAELRGRSSTAIREIVGESERPPNELVTPP